MANPTITNSYGQSKWGTTTMRLNVDFLDTGSTLTEHFTALARGFGDAGSWTRTGDCYVVYDYLGFWNSDESFSSPRAAGTGTPSTWDTAIVSGNDYAISFTLDNTYSSVALVLTVAGNTFTYAAGTSGFKEETFTASSTAKPIFSSAADAVGDGAGTNYAGIYAPLSMTNIGATGGDVTIYWGDNDGGTTAGNWDNAVSKGTVNIASRGVVFYGKKYTDLTGLTAGATYYYRGYVTNANGSVWASETRTFKTLNFTGQKIPIGDILSLQAIRDDKTKSYIITANIDASSTSTMNRIYLGATPTYWGFYPIAYHDDSDTQEDPFSGVLDGAGHTITGLYGQDLNDNGGYGVMFGRSAGTIQNFTLIDPVMANAGAGNTGIVVGFANLAGLLQCIGIKNPTITLGSIWGGSICGQGYVVRDCFSKGGTNVSTSVYNGGISGEIASSVKRCWSSTTMTTAASSGGICGQDYYAPLTYCFATGKSNTLQSGCLTGYMYTSETGNYWYNNALFSTYAFGNYNNGGASNLTATAFTDTADFKGNSTHTVFATWDFKYTWKVVTSDFPELRLAGDVKTSNVQILDSDYGVDEYVAP